MARPGSSPSTATNRRQLATYIYIYIYTPNFALPWGGAAAAPTYYWGAPAPRLGGFLPQIPRENQYQIQAKGQLREMCIFTY